MITINLGKGDWPSFDGGVRREWLVTNGLGGYASSTVICANTRKYHGLLVASLAPPVRRTVLLSKVDERFEAGGRVYNLASNRTVHGVTESGFVHLQRVLVDEFPTFIYSFAGIFIEKTVFMTYRRNTTVILYRVRNGTCRGDLRLVPMVNQRDFHWTTRSGGISFNIEPMSNPGGDAIKVSGDPSVPPLKIYCGGGGSFIPSGHWFEGMFYPGEEERGESPVEDHYVPGCFTISLEAGEEKVFTLVATIEDQPVESGEAGPVLLERERGRCRRLVRRSGAPDDFSRRLALASDAFVVWRKSTGTSSVIAGYHWFNDWGRDTMISLPGLTLVTGRYDDAREILLTFARHCKKGLIPNMFPDSPGEPLYNTVDASLWFFNAVYKYLQYTGDLDFIREEMYPVLKEIAGWYVRGTDYNIRMDSDGLIMAGAPELQLTWMDAMVDGWVVTPRQGKPVEIAALWYNALRVLEEIAAGLGENTPFKGLSEKAGQSFEEKFWCEDGGYYCDVVNGDSRDQKLRPNQVIAMSLPYSPADPARARRAMGRVRQELHAAYGLRSLSYYDPDYRGVYTGDRVSRDGAYHQGTAWSWLIGPFITAYRKSMGYSPESRKEAEMFINPFREHLRDHGVGYISEIYDGNDTAAPRGCIAQAWGVAEVLRAYMEDILEIRPGSWPGVRG
ncbi:MAG: amylo-alpha-1,6-glucosidase [Bacillota bacterium]